MDLHGVGLVLHGALRWIILLAGVLAFVRAVRGARARRTWSEPDTLLVRGFVGALDLQIALGLVLYFGTSALGVRMLAHASLALKSSSLRFFAIEHPFGMLVAATILHVGTARARRLADSPARHRRTAIIVGISLVIVLLTIPWPFFPYARPLLRLP